MKRLIIILLGIFILWGLTKPVDIYIGITMPTSIDSSVLNIYPSQYINANLICDGNSLVYGQASNPDYPPETFPYFLDLMVPFNILGTNVVNQGTGGAQTPELQAEFTDSITPYYNASVTNILVVLEIGNHINAGGASVREAVDSMWSYTDNAEADGWDVFVCGTLPNTISSALNDSLTDVEALFEAEWSSHATGFIKLRDHPDLDDATEFPDGTHLNGAQYYVVAWLIRKSLNTYYYAN